MPKEEIVSVLEFMLTFDPNVGSVSGVLVRERKRAIFVFQPGVIP